MGPVSEKKRPWRVLALLALTALVRSWFAFRSSPSATLPPAPSARPAERPWVIDVHVHLGPDGVDRLGRLIDRWKFDHVVNLSGGVPQRGLSERIAAARSSKGRVTVFTSLDYSAVRFGDHGARMTASLRRAHGMGARGLKIAKLLGLGLPGPDGALLAVDDPSLDPVFEAAGEVRHAGGHSQR